MKIKLLIILLPLLILFGCGNSKEEDIKIGFVANLTGKNSELGISSRNALQIAADEVNEKGGINGKKIQIIIRDDQNNPQKTLEITKSFKQQGINIIVGYLMSKSMKDVYPYINKNNILALSPTISSDIFFRKKDNLIMPIASNKYQGEALAEYAIEKEKVKKVVAVYDEDNTEYCLELIKHFTNKYEKLGGKLIEIIKVKSSANPDYKSTVKQILSKNPDGIVSIFNSIDNSYMCQHLKMQHYKGYVYTGTWTMTQDVIKHGGEAVELLRFSSKFNKEVDIVDRPTFTNHYKTHFNKEPSFGAIYTYEIFQILVKALSNLDDHSVESIKREILNTKNPDSIYGELAFNEFGDSNRKYDIIGINNGRFILLQ